MSNVLINGVNYDYGTVQLVLFGITVNGVTSIEYNRKQKKENNYGGGYNPISRGYGLIEFDGKIELYQDVWKQIIASSPNRDPLQIGPFDIPVVYGNSIATTTTDVLRACEFMEDPFAGKSGDTKLMVTIPLIIGAIDR